MLGIVLKFVALFTFEFNQVRRVYGTVCFANKICEPPIGVEKMFLTVLYKKMTYSYSFWDN
jgi:hypothetical protein